MESRAFVSLQHLARLDEFFQVTGDINGFQGDARPAQQRDGLAKSIGHLWVAFRDRFGASEGKLLVVPRRLSQRFPKRNHVRRRVRIQAEGIEAFGEGEHTLGGQKIVGGLESSDATEGRGSKHRASRLFPDREGHHSGGYGRGRPARTASRRVLQLAWISGRSWPPHGA